jgi:hypothetical protein
MHGPTDNLALAGAFLAGLPALSAEWSLQMSDGRARVRDRVIFWLGPEGDSYHRLGRLLGCLGLPDRLLDLQARLAPHSLRQGVGLLLDGDGCEVCLYLHHAEPEGGRERYDAYKWQGADEVDHSCYEFHFLPETPEGEQPADLVDPALAPLHKALERDPRIRAMSGFWLRRRGRRVDQVSLTYPWQPTLASVVAQFDGSGDGPACIGILPEDAGRHLRHLAFSGRDAASPSLTAYFSGWLGTAWPADFSQLRQQVEDAARAASAAIEAAVFHGLALPAAAAGMTGAGPLAAEADPVQLKQSIPPASSVYVIGCGWGEAAAYLRRTLRCRVTGITADRVQYRHCAARGLRVRLGSGAQTLPPGRFDVILVLGDIHDTSDRNGLLATLQRFGDRVLLNTGRGLAAWLRAT